jgi:hypothetical protein
MFSSWPEIAAVATGEGMDDGFTDADIFIVFQRLLLTIMPDLLPLVIRPWFMPLESHDYASPHPVREA